MLVEAPTYDRPLKMLARERAEVVALPMDEEGLDLDALEAELAQGRPGLVPLHDSHLPEPVAGGRSEPSAAGGSPSSRREHDLAILEDDPYGRVRYEGEPPPLIHELEGGERVTFTSSFSKTVAPGLRIG